MAELLYGVDSMSRESATIEDVTSGNDLVGSKVEVRASNVDELYYGALVTDYDNEKNTYTVIYEDKTEGAGLFRSSMLVPDSREEIFADEVVRVLDGHIYLMGKTRKARMLAFQDSPSLIQTTIAYKENGEEGFDYRALVFDVNQAMMLGLALLPPEHRKRGYRACVVGAGGGALPMALLEVQGNLHVDVIELSEKVLFTAGKYFGMTQSTESERLQTFAQDGLDFAQQCENERYDLYFIDVAQESGAEEEEGLDLPPSTFLSHAYLGVDVARALRPGGWAIMNVCGPRVALLEALDTVCKWFPTVFVFGTDPNYVFFMSPAEEKHGADTEHEADTGVVANQGSSEFSPSSNESDDSAEDLDSLDNPDLLYMRTLASGLSISCSNILRDLRETKRLVAKKVALGWMPASTFRDLLMDPDCCI